MSTYLFFFHSRGYVLSGYDLVALGVRITGPRHGATARALPQTNLVANLGFLMFSLHHAMEDVFSKGADYQELR